MLHPQKEEGGQRESIIPRIWRSTAKRPLSADSDADIRSIPDLDRSSHASPSKALRPSASPVIGLTKLPAVEASPISSPGKGVRDSDSGCLIKAHTGGDVSNECRDSMCEGAAVTSTFISLGDVLRGTPLTGAQSIAAHPEQRDGSAAAAGVDAYLPHCLQHMLLHCGCRIVCAVPLWMALWSIPTCTLELPLNCDAYLLVFDTPMLQKAKAAHPHSQECALQLRQPKQAPGERSGMCGA